MRNESYPITMLKIMALLTLGSLLYSCKTSPGYTSVKSSPQYHTGYDDSTLARNNLPLLMPYNKIIDPAGKAIRYGDPARENHTLACAFDANKKWLAVTDRFGLAFINPHFSIQHRMAYAEQPPYADFVSSFSGLTWYTRHDSTFVFCAGVDVATNSSLVLQVYWDGEKASIVGSFAFPAAGTAPLALPNGLTIVQQDDQDYLLVVLNGNNTLAKIDLASGEKVWEVPTGMVPYGVAANARYAYVTNWGGKVPGPSEREVAGVPDAFGKILIDPATGAAASGTVSVINLADGRMIKEIPVGLHPNDILMNQSGSLAFVANGNSDNVSVIDTQTMTVTDTISVRLFGQDQPYFGDTPNALLLSLDEQTLYVANGMDNAVAVVSLGKLAGGIAEKSQVTGFIPTEAYPAGLALGSDHQLYVANLEATGARVPVNDSNVEEIRSFYEKNPRATTRGFYNAHHQLASLSKIALPDTQTLAQYTEQVKQLNLAFRIERTHLPPRPEMKPVPVPERIGEPSVFEHVIYVIKENRTYDQVLGDMPEGDGYADLCVFGQQVTPNQHKLAREFLLLDNYYASGKSSAEGHQWTDAAITTDYVQKSVRAWFRSYPHVQEDAMVYSPTGFIWNNGLDHGKSVRIYGEASVPHWESGETWKEIYQAYLKDSMITFTNTTTISRVAPILSQQYPAYDSHNFPDVVRARTFIEELKQYEQKPGDQWPALMIVALPNDHTAGTNPAFPVPQAMVADNDLALGQIVEAVSRSRFWKNTVILVTEDDSQAGWDHVSAYRTTGFVISPYSRLGSTVHTNYNQTSMVRTIEQILGLPPMNMMDASALPMFDCFRAQPDLKPYATEQNQVPLDEMNPSLGQLQGKARHFAKKSMEPQFTHIDGGSDDLLNRILWFATQGDQPYPVHFTDPDADDDDDE